MIRFKILLPIFLLTIIFIGCSPKHSDIVLAEFGDYKLKMDEFEKAYSKNSGGIENAKNDSLDQLKRFLDLYVNYKMKLRNAEIRGFVDDPDLVEELDTYKRKVGASFVLEREIFEPGMKKYYDDYSKELRVSHIMLRPDSARNTSQTIELAKEIIKKAKEGVSFEELADKYSDDTYSKAEGGDIYWLTAGQVVPEFELAAFDTPVGEVYPEPVKTNFGYHIVKVTDKQDRKYRIKARHILINNKPGENGGIDSSTSLKMINEIKEKLNNGEKFEELAAKYSDDRGSAANGGDVGFFSRRMMVKPFDEAAFKLKVGEISDIIKTRYGYHLIEITDEEPYPSYEEIKETIRDSYKRGRYDKDYQNFIGRLRKDLNFELNTQLLNEIVNYKDTLIFDERYFDSKFRDSYKDKDLFSISKNSYPVDSLFNYAIKEKKFTNKVINRSNYLHNAVDLYSSEKLLEEKAMALDKESPEFATLMEDYRNGIYIFKIQEQEIWDKIKVDSNEVKNYFENNRDKFTWNDRVNFSEILLKQDSVAGRIYSELISGADFDSLAKQHTMRLGFKVKNGSHGMVEVNGNELAARAFALNSHGDISVPFQTEEGWSILKLIEKDPARNKTFSEAKAEVTSIYQDLQSKALEESFIANLKSIYKPKYYYEELAKAFRY